MGDIAYVKNSELAPISSVLTTLAAIVSTARVSERDFLGIPEHIVSGIPKDCMIHSLRHIFNQVR